MSVDAHQGLRKVARLLFTLAEEALLPLPVFLGVLEHTEATLRLIREELAAGHPTVHRPIPEYVIVKAGTAILCLNCGLTSHNINDVRHRFCARCNRFHTPRVVVGTARWRCYCCDEVQVAGAAGLPGDAETSPCACLRGECRRGSRRHGGAWMELDDATGQPSPEALERMRAGVAFREKLGDFTGGS